MAQYTIRPAKVGDAAAIARHRVTMFREMGEVPTEKLATDLLEASTVAVRSALRDHSYLGWLAVDESKQIIAGAGVHIRPQLPRIATDGVKHGPVPLVVNVYTEPQWRRRG